MFKLIIHEPLSEIVTVKELPTGGRLFDYLGEGGEWKAVASAKTSGRKLYDWWQHVPTTGEEIELLPGTGAKNFTEAYITRLNSKTDAGRFMKAVIITVDESPLTQLFFVDHDQPVVFNGNTYAPLAMSWQDYETSADMALPFMRVAVPNIGGEVIDYIETIDILEKEVTLQVLHEDLLGDVASHEEFPMETQGIEGDDVIALFILGMNLGFQDFIPRPVVTKAEFPGVSDTIGRISV